MEKLEILVTMKMHMGMEVFDDMGVETKINPVELLQTGKIEISETRVVMTDPDGDIVMDEVVGPDELHESITEFFGGEA